MNTMKLREKYLLRTLALLALAVVAFPGVASAQGLRAIEGTWDVTVTLRNCQTGDAIRSFPRLITFQRGGSVAEWSAAGTAAVPTTRSAGQGAWQHLGGGEYSYSLKFLRLTAFGGPDGYISETRILEFDPTQEHYFADGVAVITFSNGTQSPTLCATEEATRLY